MSSPSMGRVSAVVLAYNREHVIGRVLDELARLPLLEVLVVDNGSTDGTAAVARRHGGSVRLIENRENLGIAGRNLGAREARGEFILMVDDDSYPLEGSVERLLLCFERGPQVGVAGGQVREVFGEQRVMDRQVGTFDWFLRAGREGPAPPEGFPAFFFPEGASMVRREAFLSVGGFFEPFFFGSVELDLATRMIAAGWDVRYQPAAPFDHLRGERRSLSFDRSLHHRIRNHVWYLLMHFPAGVAARRLPAYLAFDLAECLYRRAPGTFVRALADAWRGRAAIRGRRRPLARSTLRRAELNRGRLHLRLLAHAVTRAR